ncbi:unnamed protein product [Effrenium voratum]|uniref:Uncharacterized protein n=1 Tax=Effrenium voratum TaxID=2562239 RepID=A0AA36IJQ4_9DINO|nr:unnamed protein product [Effrenium voratum]
MTALQGLPEILRGAILGWLSAADGAAWLRCGAGQEKRLRRLSELQARLRPLTQEVLQWPLLMEPTRAALQWASWPCENYEAAALRHWALRPAAGDWNVAVHLADMDYEDVIYLDAAAREFPARARRAARFLAAAASRLDVGLFSQNLLEEARGGSEGILLLFVIDGFEGSLFVPDEFVDPAGFHVD